MKVYDRRVGLPLFTLCVVIALTGATWPLNPLVTRNAQARGPVPAECEQGLAAAPAPRVNVAELPQREIVLTAAAIPAPPSRSLRAELQDAQTALARNDRPAFDAHLANAKDLLDDYPTGNERKAAEDVVRVLDDAARVWDAQFDTPFFGEDSDAFARASRYPGYADAVRRAMLVDDADHRFYPAAESRAFLARVSADRLARLGIRATTPPPTRTARATTSPTPSTTRTTTRRTPPKQQTKPAQSAHVTPRKTPKPAPHRATPTKVATKVTQPAAISTPAPAPVKTTPAPPAPVASTPVPPPPTTTVAADNPGTSDTASPPTSTTTTVATNTTPTDVTATETTATTATEAPAAEPQERRSVVVPALLILIGLGVLIVLFRASK